MLEAAWRFFAFWLKFLVAIVVVAALGVVAFLVAADYANIWAVASDGMEARAGVILTEEQAQVRTTEREELEKFFTVNFLLHDPLLKETEYVKYHVTGFEHQVDVESCFVWPWEDEKVVFLTERVPVIEGQILSEYKTEEQKEKNVKVPPPEWRAGRYAVTVKRVGGHWYIDNMKLVKTVPNVEAKPSATVNPSDTALPTLEVPVSPTPTPSGMVSAPAP